MIDAIDEVASNGARLIRLSRVLQLLTTFAENAVWSPLRQGPLRHHLHRAAHEVDHHRGVFIPNPAALERLTTAVCIEMHDERSAFPRSYLAKAA